MASTQSEIVARLYRTFLATPGEGDLIQDMGQWDVLTTEPGGVDYVEVDAGGVPAMWATPKGSARDRVLLSIHGGGYVSGSMYSHRKMFAHLAKAAGVRALIVDYSLLPKGTHPVPLDEVLTAYRWLLEGGVEAAHIAFAGDSVGGAMAITAQVRARAEGLPLPAASMPLSPCTDMEVTGETMWSNDGRDALFSRPWVKQIADDYLAGADPRDPYASPLYADFAGLGPMYVQVGDAELLLDDSRRLAERARAAGVDVRLDVFEGQQHTFQMAAGRAPEADDAIARMAAWVRPKLGLAAARVLR